MDAVLGTTSYDKIAEAIEKALAEGGVLQVDDLSALPLPEAKRLVTTGGHYAYLKIAEGCDKHCTYCIIPKLRGNYRSVPMERLVKEAEDLAKQGVKELILVAQETTVYGQDLYGEKSLPRLLRELCKIQGIWWIRLLYCYPEEVDEETDPGDERRAKDLPLHRSSIQHASDEILKRMGRRTSRAELVEIIGEAAGGYPGHCHPDNPDHRVPGRDKRAAGRTDGFCGSDGIWTDWECLPTLRRRIRRLPGCRIRSRKR